MNRRGFLKALGAAGVVLSVSPSALTEKDEARFARLAESGVIEDETFYLSGPLWIRQNGLIIRRCQFLTEARFDGYMLNIYATETLIGDCSFTSRHDCGGAIRIWNSDPNALVGVLASR